MIGFTCQVFLYSNIQFVASSNSRVGSILSPALHKGKQKGIIHGFRYIEVFTMCEQAASQPDVAKLLSITPDSRLSFQDDISGKPAAS